LLLDNITQTDSELATELRRTKHLRLKVSLL
jgi:hypothetical protein